MTIALGTTFDGGAIVCADSTVCASDGATSYASKSFLGISATRRMYAIANACEDAYAARMLGEEISDAISKAKEFVGIKKAIAAVMGSWYNGYKHIQPPQIQFIISLIQEGWSSAHLYYCEPPSTVAIGSPVAIGKGARAVEPVLDILRSVPHEKVDPRTALLRISYLMQVAKRDEAAACGGDSFAIVISTGGGFTMVDLEELKRAEELARQLDQSFESAIRVITGGSAQAKYPYPESLEATKESFKNHDSPSLKFMEKKFWKKNKKPRPASGLGEKAE